jgi:hypothetical protein
VIIFSVSKGKLIDAINVINNIRKTLPTTSKTKNNLRFHLKNRKVVGVEKIRVRTYLDDICEERSNVVEDIFI